VKLPCRRYNGDAIAALQCSDWVVTFITVFNAHFLYSKSMSDYPIFLLSESTQVPINSDNRCSTVTYCQVTESNVVFPLIFSYSLLLFLNFTQFRLICGSSFLWWDFSIILTDKVIFVNKLNYNKYFAWYLCIKWSTVA
jgi:hypothetical protein